jgi:hypothetical protein
MIGTWGRIRFRSSDAPSFLIEFIDMILLAVTPKQVDTIFFW